MNLIKLLAVLTIVLVPAFHYAYGTTPATRTFELTLPAAPDTYDNMNWYLSTPVSEADMHCLALTVYFEARNQDPDDQYAIADIVMHRTMHHEFPNTVCGVVKDGLYSKWNPTMPRQWKCAFSWYCDRKSDVPYDENAFVTAMHIAQDVVNNPKYIPVVRYALFYHAKHVNPYWVDPSALVGYAGDHVLYTSAL